MPRRSRLKYTKEIKAEIWDKYEQGLSLWSIGRAINRPSSSIYCQLAPTGGIRPRARTRSERVLSLAEREEISIGLATQQSLRRIAADLGRVPRVTIFI